MRKRILPLTVLIPLVLVGLLAACGSDPEPILVYVTPTPVTPDPTATPSLAGSDTTTLASAQSTPVPLTSPAPPGAIFGPITGADYTPLPRYTPLPSVIHEQPCEAIVIVPQVDLYASPDVSAQVTGSAADRERLRVEEVLTGADGSQWARTPGGWLRLNGGGTTAAELDRLRACTVLEGKDPDVMLFGLQVLNQSKGEEVVNFVRRMTAAGLTVGTLKGLNGTEVYLNQAKAISPETVIVYRTLLPRGDCPNAPGDTPDPAPTAREWFDAITPYWDEVNADYYEVMNECSASPDWIAAFTIETMKLANEQGRCLLLFSFPGGTPEMADFGELLPAYQYALDHPCQPGRTHGIAMHAYSMDDNRLVSEADVWIAFRHRILYDRLLSALPAAAELPVYITELGIGGGQNMPGCDIVTRDVLQYMYQLEEDPYVKGFHLWSVGTGTIWYDISPCLPQIGDALIDYYAD